MITFNILLDYYSKNNYQDKNSDLVNKIKKENIYNIEIYDTLINFYSQQLYKSSKKI